MLRHPEPAKPCCGGAGAGAEQPHEVDHRLLELWRHLVPGVRLHGGRDPVARQRVERDGVGHAPVPEADRPADRVRPTPQVHPRSSPRGPATRAPMSLVTFVLK